MGQEESDGTIRITHGEYSLLIAEVNQTQGWLAAWRERSFIGLYHGLDAPINSLQRANRTLVEIGLRNGVITKDEVER